MVVEVLVLPAGVYICAPAIYFTSLFFCLKVPLFVWVNAPRVTTMKGTYYRQTRVFLESSTQKALIHPTADFCDLKNVSVS
jgi:hypothetical protein